ncbi:uncharacterized protein PODANS_4_6616 [Podospora anserina S mat+]|uniref:Podospora anserina S mat+ genomic DNA chromosome 4, supercontig 4 n=1 Tax=Podospora anserina (strain S / ATCC MYA-4624 / DSM 980 / FGSC 10383) TaxID=515849 RepID=B2ARR6_PODAN|nr:uncharacterized protein PODANS_4_6616 [Podospora anserina S mat+]CAP66844.1 unnamed protein product [Podospora anserina S mat+]CDP28586.1 Putative protein of unknown function [Podospora anserina S mat+]
MATTTSAIPSPTWPSNYSPTQFTPAATCGFGQDLWLATLDCAILNRQTYASTASAPPAVVTGRLPGFTCGPVVNAGRPLVHFTRSDDNSIAITTTTRGYEDECYQNKYGPSGAVTKATGSQTITHYFASCPVGYSEASHDSTAINNVDLHYLECCPSGSLSFGLFSTRTEDILFETTISGTPYGGWTINMPACTAKLTAGEVVTVTDALTGGTEMTTRTTSLESGATIFAEIQTASYTVFAGQHTCFEGCNQLYESVSDWLSQYTPTGTETSTSPSPSGTQPPGEDDEAGDGGEDEDEDGDVDQPSGAGQTAGFKVGVLGAALALAVGVVAGL